MRVTTVSLLITGGLLMCASQPLLAQRNNMNPETYYRAPSSMHGKQMLLPVGTTFEGRIDTTIGSSLSHQGQEFTITLSAPLLANGTDVIVPAGSQVMGEVVEAISAEHLHRQKGMPKPRGKLRVQLGGLRTPDGQTYPLVASITGETVMMGRKMMPNSGLGGGTAYMGSAASFEAVAPGMDNRARNAGRAPTVVNSQQLARDPIWGGMDRQNTMNRMSKPVIRSLVQRGQEVFIDEGSPLTIKLDAPFRIGFNPGGAGGATMTKMQEESDDLEQTGGKRFSRTRAATPAAPVETSDPMMDQGTEGGAGQSAPPARSFAPPPEQSAPPPQKPDDSF